MLYLRKIEDYNYYGSNITNAELAERLKIRLSYNEDWWFDDRSTGYTDVLILMNKSVGKTRGFPLRAAFSHLC